MGRQGIDRATPAVQAILACVVGLRHPPFGGRADKQMQPPHLDPAATRDARRCARTSPWGRFVRPQSVRLPSSLADVAHGGARVRGRFCRSHAYNPCMSLFKRCGSFCPGAGNCLTPVRTCATTNCPCSQAGHWRICTRATRCMNACAHSVVCGWGAGMFMPPWPVQCSCWAHKRPLRPK